MRDGAPLVGSAAHPRRVAAMSTLRSLLILIVLFAPVRASLAQDSEIPFSIAHDVIPDCPLSCDTVRLWLRGELPNPCWSEPVVTATVIDAYSIGVFIRTEYDPSVECIQVLVPFRIEESLTDLDDGEYIVHFFVTADNPLATMPPQPPREFVDTFRVAPQGDQDCDGDVDRDDLRLLIDYILYQGPLPISADRVDLNCDGHIDIVDLVAMLNHLEHGAVLCAYCDLPLVKPVVITNTPYRLLRAARFDLLDAHISGSELQVTIRHGGGCMRHVYSAFMTPSTLMQTRPGTVSLYIRHDDPGDMCDALLQPALRFDLRPIAEAYRRAFNHRGDIPIVLSDYEGDRVVRLVYSPR